MLGEWHWWCCSVVCSAALSTSPTSKRSKSTFRSLAARFNRTTAGWADRIRALTARKRASALRARAHELVSAARELRVAAAAAAADCGIPTAPPAKRCWRYRKEKVCIVPISVCVRYPHFEDCDERVLCRSVRECVACAKTVINPHFISSEPDVSDG